MQNVVGCVVSVSVHCTLQVSVHCALQVSVHCALQATHNDLACTVQLCFERAVARIL
jgi:hypothetical protein